MEMAEKIDWLLSSRPEVIVEDAVRRLREGQLLIIPTETGRLLVGNLLHHPAMNALRSVEVKLGVPPILLLGSAEEAVIWNPHLEQLPFRLMRRNWPGPVIFQFPWRGEPENLPAHHRYRHSLAVNQQLRVWVPGHTLAQAIVLMADFSIAGVEIPNDFADEDLADLELQSGPNSTRLATIVDVTNSNWSVVRTGEVSLQSLIRTSARWIIFVCTGNTCRSPMAKVLLQSRLAQRLRCRPADLIARGYEVQSAGISASSGDAAALEAIQAVSQFCNMELQSHRSQLLTDTMIQQADELIVMTRSHLLSMISRFAPGGAVRLLCGSEGDLEDPIGGDSETYAECAATILRQVDRLILEWNVK
jgi:protein-tyrosine-phosphatase/tRNA A37 threonylcarbamoyladenosine synthetase subunit TsaC/SUA5/YrdC